MDTSVTGDTIAAVATAPGRGGVAVVRVSGPEAFAIASRLTGRTIGPADAGRFFHSRFCAAKSVAPEVLDDGLTLVFAAPRSYTGEDVVEFQTHGGRITPRRVLEAALSAGARPARRGEFTQRAFLNGRLDLDQAEAVIDLVDARTGRAANEALKRLGGVSGKQLDALYNDIVDVSSRIEHALDFSEDELPDDFAPGLAQAAACLITRIRKRLATAREGKLLREGALVVLAGRPNAGKSSLLNALLGEQRAIVSDTAGTTRDSIEESLDVGGWPVRLVDTAGLRTASDAIEAEGVARSEHLVAAADLVLFLTVPEDADGAEKVPRPPETVIRVYTKCDRPDFAAHFAALPAALRTDAVVTSAVTGEGLSELRAALSSRLEKLAAHGNESEGADVTTRQCALLEQAERALTRASRALDPEESEYVIAANEFGTAAECVGKILGKVYSEDLLDALFSRFCIGK